MRGAVIAGSGSTIGGYRYVESDPSGSQHATTDGSGRTIKVDDIRYHEISEEQVQFNMKRKRRLYIDMEGSVRTTEPAVGDTPSMSYFDLDKCDEVVRVVSAMGL